jgi:hypothetical protein
MLGGVVSIPCRGRLGFEGLDPRYSTSRETRHLQHNFDWYCLAQGVWYLGVFRSPSHENDFCTRYGVMVISKHP